MVFTGCGNIIDTTSSPSAVITPEPTVNATVTPEPTATAMATPKPSVSAIVTPEPTARPIVKNYKLNNNSIVLRSGLTISELGSYFDITGSELLQKLGDEFEIVGAGDEETWDGYYYSKLGITLVFNDYDFSFDEAPLMWIDCDVDKLELNGLTQDMNFKQIQAKIGTGEIIKTEYEEGTGEYEYDLTYKIGKVILIFGSFTKDAGDGYWLTIY